MLTKAYMQASLLTAELKLADPCTFRILLKNTTVLLEPSHPLKRQSYATLEELLRSYQRLDDALLQVCPSYAHSLKHSPVLRAWQHCGDSYKMHHFNLRIHMTG